MLAKFSVLLAFVSLAISVSAAPLEARADNNTNLAVKNIKSSKVDLKQVQKNNNNQKGAAYFITNENGKNNFVIAMEIQNDGKLKLANAISTGGLGSHGNSKGPDSLFSQGAVKASAAGQFVVAVNPGSNTLSMFKINPKVPTQLKLVAGPVASGGEFPVSVTISKDGKIVCALNGGILNNIQCFDVDKNKGLVVRKGTRRSLKLRLDTAPKGPASTVSHIIFSDDEKKLLVSVKGDGNKNPGFIAQFDINNGKISKTFRKVSVPNGGNLPFGMTAVPGKNAVLATDAATGFEVLDFDNTGNGKNLKFAGKSNVVKVDKQKAVCWSAHSKKTGNFYLSDIGTGTITEAKLDGNLKGSVVKQFSVDKGQSLLDLDIASFNNNRDFIYVLSAGNLAVNVMQINGPGDVKQIQTLDVGGPAKSKKLAISGDNVMGMTTVVINQ